MAAVKGDSHSAMRSTSWDGVARSHAEIAVAAPVLDLAPERKFHKELQKSMSFSNWKADETTHPLVYNTESIPLKKPGMEITEMKRPTSPTDLDKEKLETLRAAVKNDLRRAIMKRSQSNDSDTIHKTDVSIYPSAFEKIKSLHESVSEDLSTASPFSNGLDDGSSQWNEGTSVTLSDVDQSEFTLNDLEWDDLEENDDELLSPRSQSTTDDARAPWSTQPLDSFNEDPTSKKRLLRMLRKAKERKSDSFYRNTSLDDTGTSFIAYSKIAVPTYKSNSYENECSDGDRAFHNRLCSGFLDAGKKVLSSVWTWAVAAVLIAGVKTLTSYGTRGGAASKPASLPPTRYWVESNQLDFDWDEDVEFKLHRSSRK